MTVERRLAQLERALSPTELVLAWLEEAHGFDDFDAYLRWLVDRAASAFPANRLARQAVESTRVSLRGRPREMVDAAVRKALRATLFRLALVLEINVAAEAAIERHELVSTLLALRLATLSDARPGDAGIKAGDPTEELRRCHRQLAERVAEVRAMETARTTVEARYLAAQPALFPALHRRWDEGRKNSDVFVSLAARLAELDGWADAGAPDDASATDSRLTRLVADLVEPARVTALEQLGEGARAFGIATG